MKKTLITLVLLLAIMRLTAIEGMWLPILLQQLNEKEMQQMGFRLTAEDIYSVNQNSMKDAIVIFGRGCTGEIISPEGLLLTNHHCGHGAIQRHSSLENDYLQDGFWAMNRSEELPNAGLTVTLLVRMEDVTQTILKGVNADMSEIMRDSIIRINIKALEKQSADSSGYDAQIRPFYFGNEYYIFFTETFRDVRLVGAPPSNIGNFGGDTDNWMWPRHTGDFSLFRIYADENNKPADYSPDNVPYTPKYHFPISLKGVEKDDFTFVFGYPGRTQQYLPAVAVEGITEVSNPVAIKLRERRLETFQSAMNESQLVRIQYASKYAGVANGWKKMIGESRGIKRMEAIDKKREHEQEFMNWAASKPAYEAKYGGIIPAFEAIYKHFIPLNLSRTYMSEAGLGIEMLRFAGQFADLVRMSKDKKKPDEEKQKRLLALKNAADGFFKNYHEPIDKKIMAEMLEIYFSELNPVYHPEVLTELRAEFNNDFEALSNHAYEKSIFADPERLKNFLDNYKPRDHKKIERDVFYRLASGLNEHFRNNIAGSVQKYERQLDSLQRIYVQGLMEMQPERRFYPDANFTLRITYGKVDDYYPMDAVHYSHYSTIEGIMEKENPDIYDYVVEDRLKELYSNADYGRYADSDGQLRVCFIASNHTTGGNSGSPVLNADGHLVGINFDRNWEGTMSDLMYDPDMCRNISLDIRYCLFIIDKFAGAGHLVGEMSIIE
ncbi:MAG: S46 family peptidase [Bacteroidales bacterium]|nr:S46 family peptidase [Bacteroidales bacterium]